MQEPISSLINRASYLYHALSIVILTDLNEVEKRSPSRQGLEAVVRESLGIEAHRIFDRHLTIALMAVRRNALEILGTTRALALPTFRIWKEKSKAKKRFSGIWISADG